MNPSQRQPGRGGSSTAAGTSSGASCNQAEPAGTSTSTRKQ
jgi:hypothetical protein